MKNSINLWQLLGFATTALGGTVLHFLYDKLGGALWIAPFSSVNESTWEHMKLLFWPMLVFALTESLLLRERGDFWCVKLRGILLGLLLIPTLFYGYNAVIGKSPDPVNIAIFFVAAAASYLYEARAFGKGSAACKRPWASLAALCFIGAAFIIFTFFTPSLAIFKDPVTSTYGL